MTPFANGLEQLAQELWTVEQTARLLIATEDEFSQSIHSVFLKIKHAQAELDVLRMTVAKV